MMALERIRVEKPATDHAETKLPQCGCAGQERPVFTLPGGSSAVVAMTSNGMTMLSRAKHITARVPSHSSLAVTAAPFRPAEQL